MRNKIPVETFIMNFKNSLFLFCLLFSISCDNSPKKSTGYEPNSINHTSLPYTVNIEGHLKNEQTVLLSSIGKELEYIPLETTSNSLMGEILRIEFTQDYIFITANPSNGLLQFDRKGKFIRIVGGKGRGPGEYPGINDFCVDQKNEKVYISCWDASQVLEYNFNGEYIRSLERPWESTEFLVYDTVGFVFGVADYSPTASGITTGLRDFSFLENNLIITDFECNPLLSIKRHFMRNSNFGTGRIAFYNFEHALKFKQLGVDTLYTLKENKLKPYAIFNLGKRKMDPNLVLTRTNRDEVVKQVENDIWIRRILENQDYLFININLGLSDSSTLCIYNKRSSHLDFLKSNEFENDINGCIAFWPKYIYNDSIMIDYLYGYQIKTLLLNEQPKKLTEDAKIKRDRFFTLMDSLHEASNPVLVVLK
jgi:hypothetical protein